MELSRLFPTAGRRSQYTPVERSDSYAGSPPSSSSAARPRRLSDPAPGVDDHQQHGVHERSFADPALSGRYSVYVSKPAGAGAESDDCADQGGDMGGKIGEATERRGMDWSGGLVTRKRLGLAGLVASFALLLLTALGMLSSARLARLRAVLSRTSPFKTVTHTEAPSPLWGAVSKPYPTGAFWTNLVVKQGEGPVALHPYGVKCLESGVHVSYGASRRSVTQVAVIDTFASDWQISSLEPYAGRGVERYDNGSVTMAFTTAAAPSAPTPPSGLVQTQGRYRAYLVKGSPFLTVAFDNATPVLSSVLMKIVNVDARIRNNVPGVQYIVTLGNFQKWLVYCSEPVALVWKDNALTSPVAIRGVIRLAILPAQQPEQAFALLMSYVQRYPIGMQTSFSYAGGGAAVTADKSAVQTITFTALGQGSLLMLALPHHLKSMLPGAYDTDESKFAATQLSPLYSLKGRLRPVVGDTWRMLLALPAVSWNYGLSEKLGTAQLDQIAFQLMLEVKTVQPTATDPYGFGKEVGRMARLALIADYLGIPEARLTAIQTLEASLVPWVTGTNANALLYDKTWGGLISSAGWADAQADYGAGWYSDHHFHYGYLVYGAAVLARLDAPFYDAYKSGFDALVRDICNPDPADPDFPVARHKDFFDGHSWASGLFQQANGKGQESSSEAANAYYACYLYALSTANRDLQWFSHAMLAMEVQAAQLYWHMPNDDVYDAPFTASRMVGNIGAFDATTTTWFGSELEFVHGIQMMPVTPVTAVLFDQPFAQMEYPLLAYRLPPAQSPEKSACSANSQCVQLGMAAGACCPTAEGLSLACCDPDASGNKPMQDEWRSLIYINHAIVDREAARQQILQAGGFGTGNSRCNSLFWAASRPAPPQPTSNDASAVSPPAHAPDYIHSIRSSCQANSACDAAGLVGECCPTARTDTAPSQFLGCCPRVV